MTTSTARSPRRSRSRRGEGDSLRAEILAATARLLVESGDEGKVSVRAVADAVGVTPPSIYLHFADKDALILEVCEQSFRAFDDDQESAGAAYDDPVESLRARGHAYARFGLANREAYRILFMTRTEREIELTGSGDEPPPAGVVALTHFVAAVGRCIDAGAFAPADPLVTALQLWAGLHGLVSLVICEEGFPWPPVDVLVDGILDMQCRGLAPQPSAATCVVVHPHPGRRRLAGPCVLAEFSSPASPDSSGVAWRPCSAPTRRSSGSSASTPWRRRPTSAAPSSSAPTSATR